jgi:hypothetical protein
MKPRCRKCGRILSDPDSIARGMGPTCAGVTGGGRKGKVSIRKRSGIPYNAGAIGSTQVTLPIGDTAPKRLSKRDLARQNREERRRLFDERLPFQCGLLLPERKPVIYTPTEEGGWKDSTSGRVISHERLQSYLKQYRFI